MLETLQNLFNGTGRNSTDSVHDVKSFNLLLRKERARADRQNTSWALVVFDVDRRNGNQETLEILISVIVSRIRLSDSLGWIGDSGLCIFLSDTAADGARKLLADISRNMSQRAPCPANKIYLYPSGLFPEFFLQNMMRKEGERVVTGV